MEKKLSWVETRLLGIGGILAISPLLVIAPKNPLLVCLVRTVASWRFTWNNFGRVNFLRISPCAEILGGAPVCFSFCKALFPNVVGLSAERFSTCDRGKNYKATSGGGGADTTLSTRLLAALTSEPESNSTLISQVVSNPSIVQVWCC